MTIIVLLILAGVSLNAIVGENGIIKQAIDAKSKMEDADRREQIEMMVTGYVFKTVNVEESLPTYLESRKGKEIDDAMQVPDPDGSGVRVNVVKKDGHYYIILEENGNYRVEEMNTDLGEIGGGITLATPENFKSDGGNGAMSFDPGDDGKSTLVFSEKIEDEFSFDIRSGEVTIYIDDDMTLTNEKVEPKRSAINIEPGAKLNLYVAEGKTLTVNSGFGETGEIGNENGAKGGTRRLGWDKSCMGRF